jgi:hypothetical protein
MPVRGIEFRAQRSGPLIGTCFIMMLALRLRGLLSSSFRGAVPLQKDAESGRVPN